MNFKYTDNLLRIKVISISNRIKIYCPANGCKNNFLKKKKYVKLHSN